jgi:hypothetical protein
MVKGLITCQKDVGKTGKEKMGFLNLFLSTAHQKDRLPEILAGGPLPPAARFPEMGQSLKQGVS